MNDLYIHQLETENKQLREALKSTNEVAKEYVRIENYCDELKNKIDKAIEYINDIPALIWNEAHEFDYDFDKLLEILGGKE